jgi:hypothetical protein
MTIQEEKEYQPHLFEVDEHRIVQLEGRSTEGVAPETKHGQREGLLTVKMGYATFVKDDNRL